MALQPKIHWAFKTQSELEPVLRYEPSTYQSDSGDGGRQKKFKYACDIVIN